jgi:hypothetical protein
MQATRKWQRIAKTFADRADGVFGVRDAPRCPMRNEPSRAARSPSRPGPFEPRRPRVLVALWAGGAEQFPEDHLGDVLECHRVEDRRRVFERLHEVRADVLLLPPLDAAGVLTAPLVGRCALEAPATLCVVACAACHGAGQAILAAARAGAAIVLGGGWWSELRGHLRLNGTGIVEPLVTPATAGACIQLMQPAAPAAQHRVLLQCIVEAPRRLSVSSLAATLNVSRRTLVRYSTQRGWPPPRELIVWGRLLHLALSGAAPHSKVSSSVRESGFRSSGEAWSALRAFCDPLPAEPSPSVRGRGGSPPSPLGRPTTAVLPTPEHLLWCLGTRIRRSVQPARRPTDGT